MNNESTGSVIGVNFGRSLSPENDLKSRLEDVIFDSQNDNISNVTVIGILHLLISEITEASKT